MACALILTGCIRISSFCGLEDICKTLHLSKFKLESHAMTKHAHPQIQKVMANIKMRKLQKSNTAEVSPCENYKTPTLDGWRQCIYCSIHNWRQYIQQIHNIHILYVVGDSIHMYTQHTYIHSVHDSRELTSIRLSPTRHMSALFPPLSTILAAFSAAYNDVKSNRATSSSPRWFFWNSKDSILNPPLVEYTATSLAYCFRAGGEMLLELSSC